MIWRNGNDIKRKEETDDIINACYQNEDEISECLQELKFSSSSTLNRKTESFKDENYACGPNHFEIKASQLKEKDFTGIYPLYNFNSQVDYKQGLLGNCWLIAAFNIMKPNYHRIERIILKKGDKYIVCIFIRGKPTETKVDACFPVNEKGELVYASSENQLYASLIERAFALENKGYEILDKGGLIAEGIYYI